ncbi:MAG: ParB/RepB/Spo0J family partition protein [Phycisphaeraceae bacterium]|nr:ParB/RepB/Spo0J family partition protein [Phycisphaeraceae bacterium]
MSSESTGRKERPSRLGRGLSTLMGQSIPVDPATKDSETNAKTAGSTPEQVATAEGPPRTHLPTRDQHGSASASTTSALDDAMLHVDPPDRRAFGYVPVNSVLPNPEQPRKHFDEASLRQLASSIRMQGVMQPVLVLPPDPSGRYILIAGERRWRAAMMAGLEMIPAIVRRLDQRQLAEWALLENLQREDLNPMERAEAFSRLVDQHRLSHEDLAARLGIDRSSVTNTLRLLNLCPEVQEMVRQGQLTLGHARVLASVEDPSTQAQIARTAIEREVTVRGLEQVIRNIRSGDADPEELSAGEQQGGGESRARNPRSAHYRDLEQQIGSQLNTRVKLVGGKKKGSGKLTIEFFDMDQFDGLMARLGVRIEL